MFAHLLSGLGNVVSLHNLLLVVAGTAAGMAVGALPGLTATMAVALLVPFTYGFDATSGLVLLGKLDSDLETLNKPGLLTLTVERIED